MTSILRRLSILLPALLLAGCASFGPRRSLVAEILSEPAGLEMAAGGEVLGRTPFEAVVPGLGQALELSPARHPLPVVERRIRVLGPERVQTLVRLGDRTSGLAQALGLTRVVVFEYGSATAFDTDGYQLAPDLLPILKRQARLLDARFPGLEIHVCGHTDASDGAGYPRLLALRRAEAVADALEAYGLDRSRVRVRGFGGDYPVTDDATAGGRELNRRTEIVLPE